MQIDVERWPGGAPATVIAAVVTGVCGLGIALVTGLATLTRRWSDGRHRRRQHQWDRLTWSLEMVASAEPRRAEIGLVCTRSMYDIPGLTAQDRAMARKVLELAESTWAEREDGDHHDHTQH
ncbi:hypothetical protein ASF23_11255 [Curtobacterium sp. Leaf261]|nr:hypothetical protein ASF23_11255 [Curtobacterium sp. Leaf261]